MRKTYGPEYPRTLGALMAWSELDPSGPAVTDSSGTLDRRAFQNRVLCVAAVCAERAWVLVLGSRCRCRTGRATSPQSLPALGLARLPSTSTRAFAWRRLGTSCAGPAQSLC